MNGGTLMFFIRLGVFPFAQLNTPHSFTRLHAREFVGREGPAEIIIGLSQWTLLN